jgi:hypothetical protein
MTVKDWLNTLEESYRSEALANMDEETSSHPVISLHDALGTAFIWDKTPQGHEYWADFYYK